MLPDPGLRPQVMVPPEYTKWVTDQPDNILAGHKPLRDIVAMPYLIPNMDIKHDAYIMDVIRKEVTRNLSMIQPDIIQDMRGRIDGLFGTDTESLRDISLYTIVEDILFKSSNRMFVGEPLCHNKTFLRSLALFANVLGAGAVFVGEYLPLVLKPIFGYTLAVPIYLVQAIIFRQLVPVVKQRMINVRRKKTDPNFDWDQPKDMLMWVVIAAMNRGDAKADRAENIAQCMLFMVSLDKLGLVSSHF